MTRSIEKIASTAESKSKTPRHSMKKVSQSELTENFKSMGIQFGDVILIRASLGAVGRIQGGAEAFINALLDAIGPEGTIVSLAFTEASFIKKPKIVDAFDLNKKSYAGALPNAMIRYDGSIRSRHPTCSYVAIGKFADEITRGHDENASAYEPIRKIIALNGKCMLVGCVGSSPGFTTTHLAEADLGLLSLYVFPKLLSTYYKTTDGEYKLFRRPDVGMCSQSFYKFYSLYVANEILTTGRIGDAYSIIAPAKKAYEIDLSTLNMNHRFNVCGSKLCLHCNVMRWDRIYLAPMYVLRYSIKKLKGKIGNSPK
jgi:aminoglycoside N3'-acetyltransferase